MSTTLILNLEEMQDRNKWLEARTKGIGGSDASVIVGCNPWKSLYAIACEKKGMLTEEILRKEETKEDDNERMLWGRILEEPIANFFSKKTGKRIMRKGLIRSNEYPWMLASVDRMIVGENAGLEIKTGAGWKKNEWDEDEIPDAYYIQCLHYMAVTGCDKWYIAYLLGGCEFGYKVIERNEDDIQILIQKEKDFWDRYVVGNELPPVDGHSTTTEALKVEFATIKHDEEDSVPLDGEINLLINDLNNLKEDKKKLDLAIATRENKLRAAIGEYKVGFSQDYKVNYPIIEATRLDEKALKAEMPEIYKRYAKTNSYRRFFISMTKEAKARLKKGGK